MIICRSSSLMRSDVDFHSSAFRALRPDTATIRSPRSCPTPLVGSRLSATRTPHSLDSNPSSRLPTVDNRQTLGYVAWTAPRRAQLTLLRTPDGTEHDRLPPPPAVRLLRLLRDADLLRDHQHDAPSAR